MIATLKGKIYQLTPTKVILDTGAVGYEVFISLHTYSALEGKDEAFLFIQSIYREDAHILFGFHEEMEKQLFNLLLSVSGVGPSSAMALLSTLTTAELIQTISDENHKVLEKVKGIGAKTAQRIVIDLSDKVRQLSSEIDFRYEVSHGSNKIKKESLLALETLGIPRKIAEKKIDVILMEYPNVTVEELIKQVLQQL